MSGRREAFGLVGVILVFVSITAVAFYGIGFYSGQQSGQLMAIEKHMIKEQAR